MSALHSATNAVIPAKAGTHLLMPQEMGPRFRGDDKVIAGAGSMRCARQ